MIDQLIQQLQDSDPAVRRRAIIALGRSKNASVLPSLARIVRSDPDPELRELARKAGQYIRRQMQQQANLDEPTTGALLGAEPPKPAAPRYKSLTEPPPAPPAKSPTQSPQDAAAPEDDYRRFMRPTAPQPETPADTAATNSSPKAEPPMVPPFVEPKASDASPRPSSPVYDPYAPDDEELPDLTIDDEPPLSRFMPHETDGEADERRSIEDDLPEPDFGEVPELAGLIAPPEPKATEPEPPVMIVRGRKYEVSRDNRLRAREYLDNALTLNMNGDNAKAMGSLTEAISLDPNLINDGFFNNVAATITGLDGDAAAQMIIDRNRRKEFTEQAVRSQEARRVEQHLNKAQQSTWTDVWFEVGLYTLIVIIGPLLAVLVTSESVRNLMSNYAAVSTEIPEQFRLSEAAFNSLSFGSMLPIGIVSGISGVLSLLFQTALIHYIARALGGVGTWRHLIQVLLGFYNKWFPILFFILYLTVAVTFVSLFSPVVLCVVLILVGLSLYVSGKTSGKVGEAYDFGAGKGCITVIGSLLIIGLINLVIGYLMVQSLSLAFNQLTG